MPSLGQDYAWTSRLNTQHNHGHVGGSLHPAEPGSPLSYQNMAALGTGAFSPGLAAAMPAGAMTMVPWDEAAACEQATNRLSRMALSPQQLSACFKQARLGPSHDHHHQQHHRSYAPPMLPATEAVAAIGGSSSSSSGMVQLTDVHSSSMGPGSWDMWGQGSPLSNASSCATEAVLHNVMDLQAADADSTFCDTEMEPESEETAHLPAHLALCRSSSRAVMKTTKKPGSAAAGGRQVARSVAHKAVYAKHRKLSCSRTISKAGSGSGHKVSKSSGGEMLHGRSRLSRSSCETLTALQMSAALQLCTPPPFTAMVPAAAVQQSPFSMTVQQAAGLLATATAAAAATNAGASAGQDYSASTAALHAAVTAAVMEAGAAAQW